MPKYLYNGVELPPLPEWDKKAYPYAVLNYSEMTIDGNWWTAVLTLYSEPVIFYDEMVDDYHGYECGSAGNWMMYIVTDNPELAGFYLGDKWGELAAGVWALHSSGKADGIDWFTRHEVTWTNHDILNSVDNSVEFPASYPIDAETGEEIRDYDPVPVSPVQINPALLVQSFFTGQAIRRMRGKPVAHTHAYTPAVTAPTCTEKGFTTYTCACGDSYTAEETEALGHAYVSEVVEPTTETEGYTLHTCSRCGDSYKDNYTEKLPEPVAYLYGKVQAPVLPEYDAETYPYLFIRFTAATQKYTLHCIPTKLTYVNGYADTGGTFPCLYYSCTRGSYDKWSGSGNAGTFNFCPASEVKWANHDILNADGSVYKAGSDPVPVYE